MRIVIDTSVLISALITSNTPPDLLYQAWKEGRFDLVTSQAQLDELKRVTDYKKLQRFITPNDVADLLSTIDSCAVILATLPDVFYSPDPNDNHIIAAAIVGDADLIVSGGKRHLLSLQEVAGIPIITTRQAIEQL